MQSTPQQPIKRKFLLKRDNPEHAKLFDFHAFPVDRDVLPSVVDLRPKMPPVFDQGDLGSCTANAIGGAYEYDQIKQGVKGAFCPSRLFIYYNERKIENSVSEDAGAAISDGVICVHTVGVVDEKKWPYDISKFAVQPPKQLYAEAKKHESSQYKRIAQDLNQLKTCLHKGYPVIFGMEVFESFESDEVAKTGVVPMPGANDQSVGGHAILQCGYDDSKQCFIVRNSWGSGWGDKGYFYLPYKYVTDPKLCNDFWAILSVTDRELSL